MVPGSERLQTESSSHKGLGAEELQKLILTIQAGFEEEQAVRKVNRQFGAAVD